MRPLALLVVLGACGSELATSGTELSVTVDDPPAEVDCLALTLANENGSVSTRTFAVSHRLRIANLAVGAYDVSAVAYAGDCDAVPANAPWSTAAPVAAVVLREQTTFVGLTLVRAGAAVIGTAFGIQSVDVVHAISVPADPSLVVYPDAYLGPSSTITVEDPYCRVARDTVVFPVSYLGVFPLPQIRGAPLPAGIQLGMNTKDFWGPGLDNPALTRGCSGDLHVAFADTVARLKKLGASYVAVTSFDRIVDGSAAAPVFDPADEQVHADDMRFIAATAHAAGLSSHFIVQVSAPDERGVLMSSTPSLAWLSAFFDAYQPRLVGLAAEAEAAGIDEMSLNWFEFFLDRNDPDREDLFAARLLQALTAMRAVYHGRIFFIDDRRDPGPLRPQLAALENAVDEIMWQVPTNILAPGEDDSALSVDFLLPHYRELLAATAARVPAGKPLIVAPFVQSARHFFEVGWIEDAPPWGDCDVDCAQLHVYTDFSVQAIAYEAFLEAVAGSGMAIAAVEPPNYWYTDEILPRDLFPNHAQTVRNKPAEVILYNWFKR